jgi:hypothetical protein
VVVDSHFNWRATELRPESTFVEIEGLMQAGVEASAIWGWMSTILAVSMNGPGGGGPGDSGGGAPGSGGTGQGTGAGGSTGNIGSSDGGSGVWGFEDQSEWRPLARLFQKQVTGFESRQYWIGTRSFDGWNKAGRILLDARSRYSQFLENGVWKKWFIESGGLQGIVEKALGQQRAAGGVAIEWHVMEADVADALRKLFSVNGIRIKVVHVPLASP